MHKKEFLRTACFATIVWSHCTTHLTLIERGHVKGEYPDRIEIGNVGKFDHVGENSSGSVADVVHHIGLRVLQLDWVVAWGKHPAGPNFPFENQVYYFRIIVYRAITINHRFFGFKFLIILLCVLYRRIPQLFHRGLL